VDGLGEGARREPSVAFDRFGNLYLAYAFGHRNSGKVVLLQSSDGGATFPSVRVVRSGTLLEVCPLLALETPSSHGFLAVGRDGSSSSREAVYLGWVESLGLDLGTVSGGLLLDLGLLDASELSTLGAVQPGSLGSVDADLLYDHGLLTGQELLDLGCLDPLLVATLGLPAVLAQIDLGLLDLGPVDCDDAIDAGAVTLDELLAADAIDPEEVDLDDLLASGHVGLDDLLRHGLIDLTLIDLHVVVAGATSSGLGSLAAFGAARTVSDLPVVTPLSYEEPDAAVGPAGELYVTWALYEKAIPALVPVLIFTDDDEDGLFASGDGFGLDVLAVTTSNVQYKEPVPACSRGITASPRLAVARTGTFRGRVYLTYVDEGFEDDVLLQDEDNMSILCRTSDDGLATFSLPKRVNDAGAGAQFQPAIATDPIRGDVGMCWYDTSPDPAGLLSFRAASMSFDGGAHWTASLVVSQGASSDPAGGFGPRQGLAIHDRCAIAAWTDDSDATDDNPDGESWTDVLTALFQNGPR
jgi:hypothetical protein